MDKKTQQVVVGVSLVGLFVIFGVMLMSSEAVPVEDPFDIIDNDSGAAVEDIPSIGEGILASRTFTNGTHIYAGIIALPTPCHSVETDVRVAESFPEQVTIQLNVSEPSGDQMCAQVVTPQLFSVEFEASQEARVQVLRDGELVAVQLVEELPPLE